MLLKCQILPKHFIIKFVAKRKGIGQNGENKYLQAPGKHHKELKQNAIGDGGDWGYRGRPLHLD